MSEREEKFEKMLQDIQKEYNETVGKMEKLYESIGIFQWHIFAVDFVSFPQL